MVDSKGGLGRLCRRAPRRVGGAPRRVERLDAVVEAVCSVISVDRRGGASLEPGKGGAHNLHVFTLFIRCADAARASDDGKWR
jgi:hypothetical protein